MTKPKHLPECFNGRQRSGGLPCICDRLRACEQRVLEQNARAFDVAVIKHLLQEERAAALDAAREAVAALFPQERYPHEHAAIFAAIDALREEQK